MRFAAPRQLQPPNGLRLYQACTQLFEARPVRSESELAEAQRIRFQTYCEEAGHAQFAVPGTGLEVDAYDSRSLHRLLVYRPTAQVVGAVRVIPAAAESDEVRGLPFHGVCDPQSLGKLEDLAGATVAEVSRFCVTRRLSDEVSRTPLQLARGALRSADLRGDSLGWVSGQAKLQLFQAVVSVCADVGVTHVCAVVEPGLLGKLAALGLHFIAVGPLVQHHGLRQPCYAPLDWLLGRMRSERPDVWQVVTDGGRLAPGV